MTTNVKIVAAGGLLLAAFALSPLKASAAPMLDPGVATAADVATTGIENARWVCGPYRCWWRPNYYYHPWGWGWHRPWGYGYGWHRPWGWHRWGWHRGWGWRHGWRRW